MYSFYQPPLKKPQDTSFKLLLVIAVYKTNFILDTVKTPNYTTNFI